jgi:hypothetical protein
MTVRAANLAPTSILDHERSTIRALAAGLARELAAPTERAFVQAAHRYLAAAIRPVYTLDEFQPASETLKERRGSCSQRLACLEALARARDTGTRVRALGRRPVLVSALPPVPPLHPAANPARLVPIPPRRRLGGLRRVVHAGRRARRAGGGRVHQQRRDAVRGRRAHGGRFPRQVARLRPAGCDLSRFVVADAGVFDTRDAVFTRFGSLQDTWRGRAFAIIFGGCKSA